MVEVFTGFTRLTRFRQRHTKARHGTIVGVTVDEDTNTCYLHINTDGGTSEVIKEAFENVKAIKYVLLFYSTKSVLIGSTIVILSFSTSRISLHLLSAISTFLTDRGSGFAQSHLSFLIYLCLIVVHYLVMN